MNQSNAFKKFCTVQIDTDGLWVIFQHFGHNYNNIQDIMYESSIPRFLDLFDNYKIKATFFVVGKDLLYPSRKKLLKDIVKRGHEIANHTMNHAEGFSFLPFDKKLKEIEEAERIIKDELGIVTKGFRTPSNDVDIDVLRILENKGYIYDSSLLPTYCAPLIKSIKFASLKIPQKNHYLGKFSHGLAPLSPYHPSNEAIWKKGAMKIIEVPITTMPLLRLPFHASFTFAAYHLGLGSTLFTIGYNLLKLTSLPLNTVFHTNELSDPIYDYAIRRQFGLNLPLKIKQKICNYILQAVTKDFKIITSLEYATLLDTNTIK